MKKYTVNKSNQCIAHIYDVTDLVCTFGWKAVVKKQYIAHIYDVTDLVCILGWKVVVKVTLRHSNRYPNFF